MTKMMAKTLGAILLAAGMVALAVSVIFFVSTVSSMSIVLLLLSILANCVGIFFLSYTPPKKKKRSTVDHRDKTSLR